MNPKNFYNKIADIYDERQKSPWFRLIREKEARLIEKFKKGSVLDLGCGTGFHLKHANIGLDISIEMLKRAKKQKPLVLGDGEKLPFKSEIFDTVLCMLSTINLCKNPKKIAEEIKRVLKPNGILILSATSIYDRGIKLKEKKTIKERHAEKKFIVNKVPYKMKLFSKKHITGFFNMKLLYFDSLYTDIVPRWGDWTELTKKEKQLIKKEKPSRYGCIYLMVFKNINFHERLKES